MHKFHHFLESLKSETNQSLIESIHRGFSVCFEDNEDEITWEDRKWIREQLRKPGISFKYPIDIPERQVYIPPKGKPRRKARYSEDPRKKKLWLQAKMAYGGEEKINRERNWKNVQIYYNKLLNQLNLA